MFSAFYENGAAAVSAVAVSRLLPLMSDRRKARLSSLPIDAANGCAVMAVFPYYAAKTPGNIALFARGEDYFEVIFRRLSRAAQTLPFPSLVLKNSWPLPAVAAARLSGLAFTGRHGLAICPPYGSFFALGAVLCEASLPAGNDAGFCENCGLCVSACPTKALDDGFCREKCLSHITQHKKELTEAQRAFLARSPYVWGCDICQLACPHNAKPAQTAIPEFLCELIPTVNAGHIENPPENRHFTGRGTDILRRNLHISGKGGQY